MAGDIERLIEWLIDDISCHGDRGYPVSQTLATIREYHHGTAVNEAGPLAEPARARRDVDTSDQALFSSIWDWIRERDDISIGENRQYNHLTLAAILSMPEPEVPVGTSQDDGKPEASPAAPTADLSAPQKTTHGQASGLGVEETPDLAYRPRIYASVNRMWESIAGHSADFKRVPRLEWAALVGIATTKSDGILQGDLCRLIGQDKRSLPKRTDSLAQKGYITKRTTLVRGVKTSKMWLRRLAPSMPADPTQTGRSGSASMNWSLEALTMDMEPVAWCSRWTGKSIDTHILAKTAIEIIKAWNIIRYDDLRRKLGIEGLKWQMKTQARLCRWMVRKGIVKYVAATLGERLFKDCLKFNRDFTSDDWDSYLATGKVKARTKPETEGLAPYKEKSFGAPSKNDSDGPSNDRHTTARYAASSREGIARRDPWRPEKPLPTTIMDVIRAGDTKGVPNRQIGKHTMGPPFTRYVSSISTTLATPALQPAHLTRFQVVSQLHRVEKSAIYLFSLPQLTNTGSTASNASEQLHARPTNDPKPVVIVRDAAISVQVHKGFSVPMPADLSTTSLSLSALARVPNERRQWKSFRGTDQAAPARCGVYPQNSTGATPEHVTGHDTTTLASGPEEEEPVPIAADAPSSSASPGQRIGRRGLGDPKAPRKQFIVTLKISPPALSQVLGLSEVRPPQNAADSVCIRPSLEHTLNDGQIPQEGDNAGETDLTHGLDLDSTINDAAQENFRNSEATVRAAQLGDEPDNSTSPASPAVKRGRSKAKSSKASKTNKKGSKSGVFRCDKCGGVWKNDNGLKYHLEKSSSACNSTYVPPPPKTSPFRAKRASMSMQGLPEEEAPPLAKSTRSARASGSRNAPAQPIQVTPARLVQRNPHPTHASALHARSAFRRGFSTKSHASHVDVLLQLSSGTGDGSDAVALPTVRCQTTDDTRSPGLIITGSSSTRDMMHEERHVRRGLDRDAHSNPPVTPRKPHKRGDVGSPTAVLANTPSGKQEASPQKTRSAQRQQPQPASLTHPEQEDTNTHHPEETSSMVHRTDLQPPAVANVATPNHEHANDGSRNGAVSANWADQDSIYPKFSMPATTREQDTNGYALDSRLHRASEIVLFLVQTNDGVFPGDRSAYLGFLSVWERTFPLDPPPSNNNVQVAINKLVSRKKIVKTTHAFRDAKGAFKSANVLLTRGTDPFCPAAVAVKEKIIVEHPKPYILAAFTPSAEMFGQDQKMWKGEPIFSNRRKLENDVGVLDAPFYVNERLKRRKPKYAEPDETSPSKRHRTDSTARDPSFAMDEKAALQGHLGSLARGSGTQTSSALQHVAAPRLKAACPELTFLQPNTYLEDDDTPGTVLPTGRETYLESDRGLVEEAMLPRREFDFTGATKILRNTDSWPSYDIGFFERNPSFVMDGWMPNSQWFLKCGLPHSLDEMITENRHRDGQLASHDAAFIAQVNGCRRWEISPEAKSLIALGSIAPNYIFINHRTELPVMWHKQTLVWSPENQLAFRGGYVGTNQVESEVVADTHPAKRRKYTPRTRSRLEPTVQMDMKYRTLLPWSRAPGAETQMLEGQTLDGEDDAVVIAAFVATRTLLGGADKYIEWGLMMKLFPSRSLAFLRKFWSKTRRDRPASVKQLTERFQKRFIAAYERNEIPPLDFNDYVRYDWVSLIRWTASLVEDSVALPSARADLEQHYSLEDAMADVNDWQEDYYNVQSSIYNRLEAVTSKSAAVLLDEGKHVRMQDPDLIKAKTWIRSLCSTQQGLYTAQETREKMASLTERGEAYNNDLLERAIDTLQSQNVIARTRRRRYENRSYRLSEWYLPRLAKQSHEQKFVDAVAFKAQLDSKFRRNEEVRIPYVIRDGEVMAMVNLQAHGRVTVSPVDMPQIPLGFKPGVYESRKFPKSFYNFGLRITPTSTYVYDDEIDALRETQANPPASQTLEGALPLWSDFFGALKVGRWRQVLGAVTFAIAMRGPLDIGGVVTTLKPNLEDFEVQLVIEWGLRHGVLKRATPQGTSYTTAEWWWLLVGRQRPQVESEMAA